MIEFLVHLVSLGAEYEILGVVLAFLVVLKIFVETICEENFRGTSALGSFKSS